MSVWDTIQYAVSENVIRRVEDSPVELGGREDSYYARRHFSRRRSMLRNMADFHNNGVKNVLYKGVPRFFECMRSVRAF